MIKLILPLILVLSCFSTLEAQRLFTRDGNIHFFSDASLEKIEAKNTSGTSVIDIASGRIEFAVLIKGFQFEKALMQEHFNENYMESDKFPKSTFKGNFAEDAAIDWTKDGEYTAEVSGDLTIHGVSKPLTTSVTITIANGLISAVSKFIAVVADYDIEIPAVVRDNIAKELEITVEAEYKELKR